MKTLLFLIASSLLSGCIATAPVSIAWRSNTSQQFAADHAQNDKAADSNTVNADHTTEALAAISTSSGKASAAQSKGKETSP